MSEPSQMKKIRVGVLRGGPSGEYEVSLESGASVLKNLLQNKYHGVDIFIDQKGKWHVHGMECHPQKAVKHLDVIFNALHGEYGEDGKVQRLLESFKIPFTGSKSFPSALAMNKILAREIFESMGITVPEAATLRKEDVNYLRLFEIFSSMTKPLVVKPATAGSSLGVSVVESLDEFSEAVKNALKYSNSVLVEKCIKGKEITCSVIEQLTSVDLFVLPLVEIKPVKFFDYKAKYDGSTQEICPAELPENLAQKIKNIALRAHKALGLRHYSRADVMVDQDGEVYLLETNTLPGLTEESLLPKSVKACGSNLSEFLDHMITLALAQK